MDGEDGTPMEMETGLPQGSPVSPVLFLLYIADLGKTVEQRSPPTVGLSFVNDITWIEKGDTPQEVATKLRRRARETLQWADHNAVQIETDKTEAIFFSKSRKKRTKAKRIRFDLRGQEVQFNQKATRWLGVFIDSQLTLRDHCNTWANKARAAQNRVRRLSGPNGLSPDACRKIQMACVQSIEQARKVTGMLKSTPTGALMAAAGMKPAKVLVDKRENGFAARLLARPVNHVSEEYPTPWGDLQNEAAGRFGSTPVEAIKSGCQDTILAGTVRIETNPDAAYKFAEENLATDGEVFWTDGSRLDNGRTGAGCVWLRNSQNSDGRA